MSEGASERASAGTSCVLAFPLELIHETEHPNTAPGCFNEPWLHAGQSGKLVSLHQGIFSYIIDSLQPKFLRLSIRLFDKQPKA